MNPNRRISTQSLTSGSQNIIGDEDRRFADLLKPIKDLTANWNVPLAEYLQNYYQELTEIQINLDGRTARVNFAEAALFLQGTASVYSKKVEFLWQTVLEMLDLLASKRALEEAESKTVASKKSLRSLDGFEMISLELARNNDMKQEAISSVNQRKMTLKFIFVTPTQLIEKEGKEIKETRVNLYTVNGDKFDLIGHKEDFRLNMQFDLGTAMIGEELSYDSELGQQSVSLCDISDTPEKNKSTKVLEIDKDVETTEIPELMEMPDTPPDKEAEELEAEEDPKRRKKIQEVLDEPKAPIEDPWEPLTPTEAEETAPKPKPIRRGRITKTPAQIVLENMKKVSRSQRASQKRLQQMEILEKKLKVTIPVEYFVIEELSGGKYKINESGSEFTDLVEEVKERIRSKKKETPVVEEVEEEIPDEQYDHNDDLDLPETHDHLEEVEEETPGPKKSEESKLESDSYEELVMKRVAAYVAQSQDYIESTDLARRVSKWHESIGPKLEMVEKRGNFDIHEYGSKILSNFPDNGAKTTVRFVDMAKSKEKEEISRLFLSTLMLANTYNIELNPSKGENTMSMDDAELTLLSTTRHHENMFEEEEEQIIGRRKKKK